MLTVIAGHDGWDTRTISARTGDYMEATGKSARGLRIGILREGFGHPESDPAVNEKVRQTIAALGKAVSRAKKSRYRGISMVRTSGAASSWKAPPK